MGSAVDYLKAHNKPFDNMDNEKCTKILMEQAQHNLSAFNTEYYRAMQPSLP